MRGLQRRIDLLPALIFVLILATAIIPAGCGTEPPPRGIILVSADTLGAGHLGLYGYGPGTSPNIDRWSQGAIVFRNAFAQLPGTLPSHMSMMTGLTPRQHGVYPSSNKPLALSTGIPTLAERLNQGGFRTAGFTEGGYVAGVYGFRRGFDQWNDRYNSWHNVLRAADSYLGSLAPDEPFFLFLHTYDIHDPYRPPEEYRAMFSPAPAPLSIEPKGSELVSVNRGRRTVSPDDVDQLRALYDAGIRLFDHQWDRLLEMLERNQLTDRTLVILTADHGEEFMEHGRLAHETVYNPGIHVPLIIQVPDWHGRRNVQSMVGLTDLPATILSWAGLPQSSFQGTDLLALAGNERDPHRTFVYSESYVDPYRVLVGRVDGRRAKLMVRKPRESEKPVACDRVCGLIAAGPEVTIRIRTVGPPLQLDVQLDGERRHTWAIDREWNKQTIRFEAGDGKGDGSHVLLFSVIDEKESAGDPLNRTADPLRIQCLTRGTLVIPEIHLFDLDADPGEEQDVAAVEIPLAGLLARELANHLVRDKQVAPPELVIYNEKQRQRLKALGYLE